MKMQDIKNQFIRCPQCDGKPHRYWNECKARLNTSKPQNPTFHDVSYRDAHCLTCKGNGLIRNDAVLGPRLYFATTFLQESRDAIVTPSGEITTDQYLELQRTKG